MIPIIDPFLDKSTEAWKIVTQLRDKDAKR